MDGGRLAPIPFAGKDHFQGGLVDCACFLSGAIPSEMVALLLVVDDCPIGFGSIQVIANSPGQVILPTTVASGNAIPVSAHGLSPCCVSCMMGPLEKFVKLKKRLSGPMSKINGLGCHNPKRYWVHQLKSLAVYNLARKAQKPAGRYLQ